MQTDERGKSNYSAMATAAAPPIIIISSRAMPVEVPALAACRPGEAPVEVAGWLGWTMVKAVTVLSSPLDRVVVLLNVEVKGVVVGVEEVFLVEVGWPEVEVDSVVGPCELALLELEELDDEVAGAVVEVVGVEVGGRGVVAVVGKR
jgi:hypothetical protein